MRISVWSSDVCTSDLILFVAWYFPPSNTIAAVRLGKLAKFLTRAAHDVRVLTPEDVPYAPTLPVEIPQGRIYRTAWTDVNAFPSRVKAQLAAVLHAGAPRQAAPAPAAAGPKAPPADAAYYGSNLSKLYKLLTNFPDNRIGWLPAARRRALGLFEDWHPDPTLATAPPFTALLHRHSLARDAGLPPTIPFPP